MLCEWSPRRAFDACLRGGKKPRLGASAVDKKEMLAESSISRSPKGSLVGSLKVCSRLSPYRESAVAAFRSHPNQVHAFEDVHWGATRLRI